MPTVTSPVATDETLQSTNTALGNLAKDSTLQTQNGKMDSIITKLQGIIDALGLDTSVYKASGSKTCAELISSLLIAGNLGNVYNVTDSGTTTADFVEGAGKPINAGDNVAIVDIGTGGSHTYKFDLLAGMVDISGKADKVSGATSGNFASLDANGNLTDSGVAKTDIDNIQDELSTDTSTVTGNPINFSTKSAQNAESTILSVEPIQDLHGYDKPWVGGAGKNKCPNYTADSYSGVDSNGVTYTKNSDGTISTSGTATATSFWRESFTFKAGTYIISGGIDNDCFVGLYKSNVGYIASTNNVTTFTLSEDTSLGVTCRIGNGINADGLKFYPMVRLSTEPEGYEPYENICPISGRTEANLDIAEDSESTPEYELTIAFGQTVYGGQLDVEKGKLTITKASIDLGSLTWIYRTSEVASPFFETNNAVSNAKAEGTCLSDRYNNVVPSTLNTENGIVGLTGSSKIRIRDLAYTDATVFKTAMDGVDLIHELATPTTIQLTPHAVSLLKGTNYISTDGDKITLRYRTGEVAILGDIKELRDYVDSKPSGGGIIYSTTEQVIGTYLDKPLYAKVFDFGNISAQSYYDITIANIDKLLTVNGYSGEGTPIPYIDVGNIAGCAGYYKTSTGVRLTTGASRSMTAGKVTIQYTKTTD